MEQIERRSYWNIVFSQLQWNRLAVAGLWAIAFLVCLAIFAPLISLNRPFWFFTEAKDLNLKAAVQGETEEFESMYPDMIKTAETEGQKAALRSFTYANDVEKVHADLYQKALDNLDSMETVDYYVCSVCGFTCEVEPPESCPVCGAKAKAFSKVD